MITLEYKAVCKSHQVKAIDEAIRTTQFIRNKCLRLWVDAGKESNINKNSISKYTTQLRKDFTFVAQLNSMAVQAAGDRAWSAISRFSENCKQKIPGNIGYPRFQKDCQLCVYENLKVRNLVKNHCLAKSINDAGWYQFRVWIEHFAYKFRKVAIAVEPHYTSQECPECHAIVKKSLSQRTHICCCGCELQRDRASSIIILNRGKAQLEGIATGGHPGSKSDKKTKKSNKSDKNAWGDATSTGSGENLNQQVVS